MAKLALLLFAAAGTEQAKSGWQAHDHGGHSMECLTHASQVAGGQSSRADDINRFLLCLYAACSTCVFGCCCARHPTSWWQAFRTAKAALAW